MSHAWDGSVRINSAWVAVAVFSGAHETEGRHCPPPDRVRFHLGAPCDERA
jgi:hypothetical protein